MLGVRHCSKHFEIETKPFEVPSVPAVSAKCNCHVCKLKKLLLKLDNWAIGRNTEYEKEDENWEVTPDSWTQILTDFLKEILGYACLVVFARLLTSLIESDYRIPYTSFCYKFLKYYGGYILALYAAYNMP